MSCRQLPKTEDDFPLFQGVVQDMSCLVVVHALFSKLILSSVCLSLHKCENECGMLSFRGLQVVFSILFEGYC